MQLSETSYKRHKIEEKKCLLQRYTTLHWAIKYNFSTRKKSILWHLFSVLKLPKIPDIVVYVDTP